MNLSKKSFWAYLYRFFYSTSSLPENLCPYFWRLVAAVIFVIPYTILALPSLIIKFATKDKDDAAYLIWINLLFGTIIWAALATLIGFGYINYHLVRYWLNYYSYDSTMAAKAGALDSIIVCFTAGHYISKWYKYRSKPASIERKEPKKYIVVEFTKAWYEKYCPKIDWRD